MAFAPKCGAMNSRTVKASLEQRLRVLGLHWEFWVAFAWIETRSIEILETVHGYRTAANLLHNANYKVPVVISEVCKFECSCGKSGGCPLAPNVRRNIAEHCTKAELLAFGVLSEFSGHELIPADAWILEGKPSDPTVLENGDRRWKNLCFSAAEIIKLYPPKRNRLSTSRPSPADLMQYVESKVEIGWNQSEVLKGAQTAFLPRSQPTRRSVEKAYKVHIPFPTKGRPHNP